MMIMIIQVPIRHHGKEHEHIILVFVLVIVHDKVQLSQGILAFSCLAYGSMLKNNKENVKK